MVVIGVDYLVNVVFATQWDRHSVARNIVWEVTVANSQKTVVAHPSPESVLQMGYVRVNQDANDFHPRNSTDIYYLPQELNLMEPFVRMMSLGCIEFLYEMSLPTTKIGVVNDESLDYLKKYFRNVYKIKLLPCSGILQESDDIPDLETLQICLDLLENQEMSNETKNKLDTKHGQRLLEERDIVRRSDRIKQQTRICYKS